jgi:hypothetical protein
MDRVLLRIQAQLPPLILSVLSLYLAGVFLLGGARVLLLLQEGTIDYATTALAQAIGYAFGPSLSGTTMVAAAIGGSKIAVGGFFILAVTERSTAADGRKEYGALNLALHGGIALTLLHLLPAWMSGDAAAIRLHAANLMLLCVAVGIGMFERARAERAETRVGEPEAAAHFQPRSDWPLSTGRAPLRDDWR